MNRNTKNRFNSLVRRSLRVYTSKSADMLEYLKQVKKKVKSENQGLKPYIDTDVVYKCLTCGTNNKSHPVTSYCFVCDTDNWELIKK